MNYFASLCAKSSKESVSYLLEVYKVGKDKLKERLLERGYSHATSRPSLVMRTVAGRLPFNPLLMHSNPLMILQP